VDAAEIRIEFDDRAALQRSAAIFANAYYNGDKHFRGETARLRAALARSIRNLNSDLCARTRRGQDAEAKQRETG
jgi:hypothetical protein